jgi:hypothetical protein
VYGSVFLQNVMTGWGDYAYTIEDGSFSYAGLPPGLYLASVTNWGAVFEVGTAQGTLTGGGWLDLPITLQEGVQFGEGPDFNLDGADGFRYDISWRAVVRNGGSPDGALSSPMSGMNYLSVGNSNWNGDIATLEAGGRQLSFVPQVVNGLLVARKVYVPVDGGFARYLEVFTNPRSVTATRSINVYGDLASWDYVNGTSMDWLTTLGAPAPYAVYANQNGGANVPQVGQIMGGLSLTVPHQSPVPAGSSTSVSWTWDGLTTPANGSACILHYLVQGAPDTVDMETRAIAIMNGTPPGIFDGLTAEEQACIVNFSLP